MTNPSTLRLRATLRRPRLTLRRATAGVATALAVTLGACGGGDGGGTTAPVAVASITVTPGSEVLRVGDAQLFQAQPRDAQGAVLTGRTVSWTTSSSTVATVSAAGLVTAVGPGNATIIATSGGVSGSATLKVEGPVVLVNITTPSTTVTQGQTLQLTAIPRDGTSAALARTVTWSSSATGVATVSSTGLVTAIAAGSVTISATAENVSGQVTLTVVPLVAPVASVTITSPIQIVAVGTTVQATATTRDASGNVLTGRTVNWSTSNATQATVNQQGLVSIVGPALPVTISATSEGRTGTREFYAFPLLAFDTPLVTSGAVNESIFRLLNVVAGTGRLTVTTAGGNGDADLIVYRPSTNDSITAVCVSVNDQVSDESCVIDQPSAGLWLVRVVGFTAFQNVTLRAVISSPFVGAAAPAAGAHAVSVNPESIESVRAAVAGGTTAARSRERTRITTGNPPPNPRR